MKIALVIGHTAHSQGAYGNAGESEFAFNDELMMEFFHKGMNPKKHEIYLLYHDSTIKGYTNRMKAMHKRIDELECVVSIELHFNSFHRPTANGNEVLYCSLAGKEIADIFDEELDALPNRDRGTKKVSLHPHPIADDRGAGFCCRGKSKAIILEPFFAVNQVDYLYGGVYRDTLLKAIQKGLERL